MNFLLDNTGTEDKPLKIPKEIWLLVNHLYTKACQQVTCTSKHKRTIIQF